MQAEDQLGRATTQEVGAVTSLVVHNPDLERVIELLEHPEVGRRLHRVEDDGVWAALVDDPLDPQPVVPDPKRFGRQDIA